MMCLEEQVKGGTKDQGKVGKNFSDEVHLEKHKKTFPIFSPSGISSPFSWTEAAPKVQNWANPFWLELDPQWVLCCCHVKLSAPGTLPVPVGGRGSRDNEIHLTRVIYAESSRASIPILMGNIEKLDRKQSFPWPARTGNKRIGRGMQLWPVHLGHFPHYMWEEISTLLSLSGENTCLLMMDHFFLISPVLGFI